MKNLNTDVLPKYNCSNCSNFIPKNNEIVEVRTVGMYAIECRNLVHPILDCILKGFKGHSDQPDFNQTLNK